MYIADLLSFDCSTVCIHYYHPPTSLEMGTWILSNSVALWTSLHEHHQAYALQTVGEYIWGIKPKQNCCWTAHRCSLSWLHKSHQQGVRICRRMSPRMPDILQLSKYDQAERLKPVYSYLNLHNLTNVNVSLYVLVFWISFLKISLFDLQMYRVFSGHLSFIDFRHFRSLLPRYHYLLNLAIVYISFPECMCWYMVTKLSGRNWDCLSMKNMSSRG